MIQTIIDFFADILKPAAPYYHSALPYLKQWGWIIAGVIILLIILYTARSWISKNAGGILVGGGAFAAGIIIILLTMHSCTVAPVTPPPGNNSVYIPSGGFFWWKVIVVGCLVAAYLSYRQNKVSYHLPVVFILTAAASMLVILNEFKGFFSWTVAGLPAAIYLFYHMSKSAPGRASHFMSSIAGLLSGIFVLLLLRILGLTDELNTTIKAYTGLTINILLISSVIFIGLATWRKSRLYMAVALIFLGFWAYDNNDIQRMHRSISSAVSAPEPIKKGWNSIIEGFGRKMENTGEGMKQPGYQSDDCSNYARVDVDTRHSSGGVMLGAKEVCKGTWMVFPTSTEYSQQGGPFIRSDNGKVTVAQKGIVTFKTREKIDKFSLSRLY